MSSATPTGFGSSPLGASSFGSSSPLGSTPLASPPYEGPAICTPDDPTGAKHTPAVKPNGTPGRVYTESLTSDNRTPAERAKSEAAFKRALMCQDGVVGAIACGQPFLEVTSASVEAEGFGASAGATLDSEGLHPSYSLPVSPTASVGNEGADFHAPIKPEKPRIKAGLCVALKGAKKPEHEVRVNASGGIFHGSTNGEDLCFGLQTPSPLDGSISTK